MQIKKILKAVLLCICMISVASCNHKNKDLGYRGFMNKATIVGDSINGYHCCFYGGGLAISYDRRLEGIERGYFEIHYKESDWKIVDNMQWIDHAHVVPYEIYEVIHPISIAEAEGKLVAGKDDCMIPEFLSLDHGCYGYFDLNTVISVVNLANGEKKFAEIQILYDPAKQTPDTLSLQYCCHLDIPDNYTNPSLDYGSVSCDFSSLISLRQWSDSVTIVVKAGDEKKHWIKISKDDFSKPTIKRL